MCAHSFRVADIELGPGPVPGSDRLGDFDLTVAERELGYVPEHSLETGLVDYMAWLKDQYVRT